jgi:hypothetical protein
MHFEFMGSPQDADDMTAKAKAKLRPSPAKRPAPTNPTSPAAAKSYTVRDGLTTVTLTLLDGAAAPPAAPSPLSATGCWHTSAAATASCPCVSRAEL